MNFRLIPFIKSFSRLSHSLSFARKTSIAFRLNYALHYRNTRVHVSTCARIAQLRENHEGASTPPYPFTPFADEKLKSNRARRNESLAPINYTDWANTSRQANQRGVREWGRVGRGKGGKVDTCRRLDIQGRISRLHVNYPNDVIMGKCSVLLSRRSRFLVARIYIVFFNLSLCE